MKKVHIKMFFLILCLIIMPGCSGMSFFDVQEAMQPPKLGEPKQSIKNAVYEHSGKNVTLKYPLVNNQRAAIIEESLPDNSSSFALAFCQTEEESPKLHILFLHQKEKNWVVFDDILHDAADVERVLTRGSDDAAAKEIIILGEEGSVYVYQYDGKTVKEIDVTGGFVDFVKNI